MLQGSHQVYMNSFLAIWHTGIGAVYGFVAIYEHWSIIELPNQHLHIK